MKPVQHLSFLVVIHISDHRIIGRLDNTITKADKKCTQKERKEAPRQYREGDTHDMGCKGNVT